MSHVTDLLKSPILKSFILVFLERLTRRVKITIPVGGHTQVTITIETDALHFSIRDTPRTGNEIRAMDLWKPVSSVTDVTGNKSADAV